MNGVTYPQTQYTYDPTTQSYARIPATPMAGLSAVAPQQIYDSGGGDSGVGSPGSSGTTSSGTVGSSGTMGGIAQGVNAAVSNVQNAIGPLSMAVPGLGIAGALSNMGVNKSMDVNEEADAALAAANQQANQATVSMGAFGPQVTTAVDISPVANPAAQEVTAISPTMGLTAMNQAQKAEEQEATPAAVAATVADAVASFADTQDAEAGAANAAAAQGPGAMDQGIGGVSEAMGSGNEGSPSVGDAPSIGGSMDAAGSNDSGSEGVGSEGASNSYQSGGLMGMGDSQPRYAYAPIMMSNGGLPAAARKVQAQGRNGDSTLVHMTQGEVKGLDAIARAYGGRITINPETGLPEANFLKSLLPVIAGAALNFAVPGLGAALGGFAIPALVGGASYLMNPQQGLMGGLMAGLGAYGGMGIGNALTAAGAATTAPAVTGTAPGLVQAGAVAPQAAATTVPGTATAGLKSALAPQAFTAAPAAAAAPPSFMGNLAQAGRGVTALGTEAGRTAAMQSLGGPMGAVKTIGAVTAPMSMGGLETPEMGGAGGTPTRIRPFKYTRTARPDAFNPASEPGAGSYERRYFDEAYTAQPTTEVLKYAMGGDIEEGVKNGNIRSFDDDYGQDEYAMGGLTAFNSGGLQDGGFVLPADVVAHLGNGSTAAGYKVLAKGLGARPIKGKGDGMSDSIPTTIDGKQPARVADGEAYVPAEKVKEVGPKRLYKMMEKVRQARTNSTRQAPAINPREYIPA
jgi:hypothetical protein